MCLHFLLSDCMRNSSSQSIKCINFDEHLDASITGMFSVESKDKSGFSVFKDVGIFIVDLSIHL